MTGHSALTLRSYQSQAIDAIRARFAAGDRSTLLVLGTGLGKTVIASEAIRRTVERGHRALFLAHRTELLTQAQSKLRACGLTAELEKAQQHASDHADVVVASVQTLRGARLEQLARRFDPALIVADEAHHAASAGQKAILATWPEARVLGLTATPDRLDGKALGDQFDSVAFRMELREGIAAGYLAPLVVRRIDVEGVDLSEIRTRAGDLAPDQLAEVMNAERALHGVVVPLLEQARDRKTLVFAVDRAHAHALADVANRYRPGCAVAIDGTASDEQRVHTLAAFCAGRFQFLVNVGLYTEGTDVPEISCIGNAAPTKSRALYTQRIGRGSRIADGKRDCLVLDFVGDAGRHRLVGPADVLAGRELADDVRAEVDALLDAVKPGEQLALDDVLVHAEDELARRREQHQATATARYSATEIDPFVGELPEVEGYAAHVHGEADGSPATAKQRTALAKLGLEKLPDTLTVSEAQRWIIGIGSRRDRGLATLPQARLLARRGYERTAAMSFADATRLITQLRNNGWRPVRHIGGVP